MATMTKIEWADVTINPIVGCTKCSPACDHCYAVRMAHRLENNSRTPQYQKSKGQRLTTYGMHDGVLTLDWTGQVRWVDGVLEKALRWRKPRRVFVGSMTDIFHPSVPYEWIDKIMAVAALTPHITWMLLTKRPERMREYFLKDETSAMIEGTAQSIYHARTGEDPSLWMAVHIPLPNVWLGATIWDQASADRAVPLLLDTPAAVRFVSCEPLLGPVDMTGKLGTWTDCPECGPGVAMDEDGLCISCGNDAYHWGLDWVICGGESGPNARPMHPDWARALRDECMAMAVPFFFKQWGAWMPDDPDTSDDPNQGWWHPDYPAGQLPGPCDARGCWGPEELAKAGCIHLVRTPKAALALLDGRQHHDFPEVKP